MVAYLQCQHVMLGDFPGTPTLLPSPFSPATLNKNYDDDDVDNNIPPSPAVSQAGPSAPVLAV